MKLRPQTNQTNPPNPNEPAHLLAPDPLLAPDQLLTPELKRANVLEANAQAVPEPGFSWREVFYGINSGAWAIVLAGVVLVWVTRKSVQEATVWAKDYINDQQKLNEQLQETVKSNSETLKITGDTLIKMADNDRAVAQALMELGSRQDKLENAVQIMANISPDIAKRQRLQVRLLTDIHRHLLPRQQPDDDAAEF